MRYVEKYGGARQAIYENIIQRMHFVCWIAKATDTHLEYVIVIAFPLATVLRLLMMDSNSIRNMSELYIKIKLRYGAACWVLLYELCRKNIVTMVGVCCFVFIF